MTNQSDNLDVAAEYTQQTTDARIAEQVAAYRAMAERNSATECVECDEPIPVPRQIAVPGVQTCVMCQGLLDLAAKGVRRV
jgi:phage/conjugal plasmid C-4 type zinc finger TraR family protein